MTQKLNLAVLISGSGSNLQALIDACKAPDYPAQINIVISNRPDAYGLERAKKEGIPAIAIDHKDYTSRAAFEAALQNALEQHPVDLICLAGFMRILTAEFIEKWPHKIINTHPALLPKFGGKGMYGEHVHQAVLNAGETESGASIHYVIPEVDQGPLILQQSVPVRPNDTIETLSARVIDQEHIIYPRAVRLIAKEKLKQQKQA
ncbi:MAG: phosphoribosylglycinamide formyltransferase [Alphaproteobacteria bacterium]|nr:phosphoribosylglycinamide formyltransferase [Alphaproteobacteria bacterium]